MVAIKVAQVPELQLSPSLANKMSLFLTAMMTTDCGTHNLSLKQGCGICASVWSSDQKTIFLELPPEIISGC